jgi:hypothetical protein
LRHSTAGRSARSAALLVGSMPGGVTNVHNAVSTFSQKRLSIHRRNWIAFHALHPCNAALQPFHFVKIPFLFFMQPFHFVKIPFLFFMQPFHFVKIPFLALHKQKDWVRTTMIALNRSE